MVKIKTDYEALKNDYHTNPIGLKMDKYKIANTRHLTRIITVLAELGYATQTQLGKDAQVGQDRYIKDALLFLIKHGIVEKVHPNPIELKEFGINKTNTALYTLTEYYWSYMRK